jgi:DHA1 family multidrug resistance protein-like MFS transporter
MLRNRLLVLASANLVIFAGITLILPLLPDIQKRNGLSTAELGLVAGVAFFSGLVGQLGLARFVDRGYARQLLLTSIALTVGALVVIALSRGLWDLVAGRFLEGLGYAMFAPAAKAIVAAHDPQRVGTNLGRLSGAELAGLVVGPLIGAVLANHFDLRVPFFVLAGAVLLVTPAIIRLDLTGMDVHRESTTPVRALIRRPFVIRAALLYLAMIFPSGVYDVLWAKLLSDRGASLTLIGLSFTIYGIPYVAFAFFGSHLIDRYGAIRSSVIGLLATLPPVILYGYIAAPIGLVLVATIEGAANAFSIPASQAAMVAACRPEEIGTGQGISGAAGIGAAGVASVVSAPLYESFGAGPTFIATATTMATILAIALLVGARGATSYSPVGSGVGSGVSSADSSASSSAEIAER